MSNLQKIGDLANQIGPLLDAEAKENQKRLYDSKNSIEALIAQLGNTGILTLMQRTALEESLKAVTSALSKIESAFGLKPLNAKPAEAPQGDITPLKAA